MTFVLGNDESENPSGITRTLYDALVRSISHQTSAYGGGKLEHAAQLASKGMKNNDRGVRLSAG
jgi:hypothetical protein